MKALIYTLLTASALLFGPSLRAADTPDTSAPGAEDAAPMALPTQHETRLQGLRQMTLPGEKLELEAAGEPFFALFMAETAGPPRGGVLLLHDTASHPDSPGVIHPLRTRLPEHGWSTLSISLPPLGEAPVTLEWLDQAQTRIGAAIAELQRRNNKTVVLAGHGSGAHAAVDYLAANDNAPIDGVVLIGLDGSANGDEPRLDAALQLARVRPSILDLFGERDQRNVISSAERRSDAARRRDGGEGSGHTLYRNVARNYSERKGDNVSYRQIQIATAGHRFTRHEQQLVKRVRGWLQRHIGSNQ